MSVAYAVPQAPASAPPSLQGVVIVTDRTFTRSALGMAFAAYGRRVPVLYSGDSADSAIIGAGGRQPVAAIVVVDADIAAQRILIAELAGAGLEVTALCCPGADPADLAGLPLRHVIDEQSTPVQDVVVRMLGAAQDVPAQASDESEFVPLPLSDMQRRVLAMFATGSSLTDIARELGVRPETVRTHLKRVRSRYREVGVHLPSRRDLYRVARMSGLVA